MIKSIMIQPRCYGCSPGSNLDFFKHYFIVIKINFVIVSFIYMYEYLSVAIYLLSLINNLDEKFTQRTLQTRNK